MKLITTFLFVTVVRFHALAVLAVPSDPQSWPVDETNPCFADTERNPENAVRACTALLDSGKLRGAARAALLQLRGEAYKNQRDFDRSVADYDQALRLDAKVAGRYLGRGGVLFAKGDYGGALRDFDEAIRLKPDYQAAYFQRGNAHAVRQEHEPAIRDYDEAIRLDASAAVVWYNRGTTYYAQGKDDLAIRDFDEAIKREATYADAFCNRANAYYRKKDYERSLTDYGEALRLVPDHVKALRSRGYVHFFLDELPAARADFAHAQSVEPADTYTALWLYLARARDDAKAARAELAKNEGALHPSGWPGPVLRLFLGRGEPAEVEAAASRADTLAGREERCEAYFYVGQDALVRGDRKEALRLFQRAIDTGATRLVEYAGAEIELSRVSQ